MNKIYEVYTNNNIGNRANDNDSYWSNKKHAQKRVEDLRNQYPSELLKVDYIEHNVNSLNKEFPCPCCGFLTNDEEWGSYNICEICDWEDDPVQLENPTVAIGANHESLWTAQCRICRTLPTEDFPTFRGYDRCKEWRQLTIEERDSYQHSIENGMDYFNASCNTNETFYWKK